MEPSCKTKTIGDPATPSYTEVKTKHIQEKSITQQHSSLTWTPQSTSTCQQCHVKLCHELSRPQHYYGP